jgi:catechol 2,3-dioxygenase-like lactoylglutathione lyase family enzyme
MLSVLGILETALYVKDLQAAANFYRRLFGFDTLYESDRLVALSVAGRDVLLLFKQGATRDPAQVEGGVIPGHDGRGRNHFAFAIGRDEYQAWRERLAAEGVAIESEVNWPEGANSLYFRDPDGHLAELITPGFWRIY